LRNDILTQKIPSGTQLKLQTLRERFGVSHTPIREALTRLVEDDLVTYYSNVGVRVVELAEQDVHELFQLLGDLDCLALKYACGDSPCKDLVEELGEVIRRSDEAIADNDLDTWKEYSDMFHLVFLQVRRQFEADCGSEKAEGPSNFAHQYIPAVQPESRRA
jgi:DNA-binding GntR family transcriptional regulator